MNKYYVMVLGKAWSPEAGKMVDEEKNSIVWADSEAEALAEVVYQGEKVLKIEAVI